MKAGELCTREVATARGAESVVDAARRMDERGVGALVVVDDERSLVPIGIITDRDLVTRALVRGEPLASVVCDVMDPTLITARADEELEDVLERMAHHGVRRVPIVDATGRLFGILTLDDIVTWLAERMADVASLLARQAGEP